jgi:hypothetical protein|nr:MAG TPA: hypothetical protein [Caudoviricetes sp.]
MNNVLKNLKAILNGLTEEELQNYDLWINNGEGVSVIVAEENSISLITNSKELKIDDRDKNLVKES